MSLSSSAASPAWPRRSALVATMAVASLPGCDPGGRVRPDRVHPIGRHRPSRRRSSSRGTRHRDDQREGYDIAVYYGPGHSGTVTADISGAKYYGVVADGAKVNVTGSKVHDIGDQPVDSPTRCSACSAAVPSSISTARAARSAATRSTTSRRAGSGQRPDRRWWQRLASTMTSASVTNNSSPARGPPASSPRTAS